MKKEYCSICGAKCEGQAVFYFPQLDSSNSYADLAGIVHVDCLVKHKDNDLIKDSLKNSLTSIFSESSENPIIASEGRVFVQNKKYDECLNVYNFEDFTDFYVPYWQIDKLLQLKPSEHLDIGVNRLITVVVKDDKSLEIVHNQPHSRLRLSYLDFEMLKRLITIAKKKVESQKNEVDDKVEKWKKLTIGNL